MIRLDGIRAITLDLDDTLWPVKPVLLHAEQVMRDWLRPRAPRAEQALAEGRYRIEDIRRKHPDQSHDMGWIRRQLLTTVLLACSEDPALADLAFDIFLAARQQVQPWPDVAEVLAVWAKRYRIAALTNGNADIYRTPLGTYFTASISASQFGVAKPDARIFHAACEALDVPPQQTLHIGDDWVLDVRGAREAGLHAVWLFRPGLETQFVVKTMNVSEPAARPFFSMYDIDDVLKK